MDVIGSTGETSTDETSREPMGGELVDGRMTSGEGLGLPRQLPSFRPERLISEYWQTMLRFEQRAHVGFSLLHLILDAEQLLQLTRSLGSVDEMVW